MTDIYLHVNGSQTGPYSLEKVRSMRAEGQVTNDTLAWHEGMTQWGTVASLLGATLADPGRPIFVASQGGGGANGCLVAAGIVAICAVLFFFVCGVIGYVMAPKFAELQKANAQRQQVKPTENFAEMQQSALTVQTGYIADVLSHYAADHGGAYPDGQTSTEVFQKLLDGKYIFDPTVFYFPMTGKTKPAGAKLTADNVCFDVTAGATSKSSKLLPIVFTTGYDVTYAADTSAQSAGHDDSKGMAVTYLNGSSAFQVKGEGGSAPHFIDARFDSAGETYRQLKP
jgi:GYF domain 2